MLHSTDKVLQMMIRIRESLVGIREEFLKQKCLDAQMCNQLDDVAYMARLVTADIGETGFSVETKKRIEHKAKDVSLSDIEQLSHMAGFTCATIESGTFH